MNLSKNKFSFIIGPPRCGTTSIYYSLKEVEGIFLPKQKEIHHFSFKDVFERTYYDRNNWISTIQQYESLYKNSIANQVCFDISPSYLASKDAYKGIHSFKPHAKLICILRNPIDRTISHYEHDLNLKVHNYDLNYLLANINEPAFENYKIEYIENSLYYKHLTKYYEIFRKDQIKLLFFDDLKNNPERFFHELFEFINVPIPMDFNFGIHENKVQKSLVNQNLIKLLHRTGFVKLIDFLNLKSSMKKIIFKEIKRKSYKNERENLFSFFENDIIELQKEYKLSLDHWKV